jgi:hypothetical protein
VKVINKEILILFLTILLSECANPAFSADAAQKSIMSVCQISDKSIEKTVHGPELEENRQGSSKHCEIVVLPGIPIPVSHQIKNKYSSRFKHQFISYSKKASSLLDINDHVIAATLNISPLSDILQI